jgi:acetylornithine deacetylase/succinyl-diaminopimelate desuccinylase-like protein
MTRPAFNERDRYVRELGEFLAIPSVSGDPARAPAMREAAEWVAARLAFADGRVVETGGHPAVLGEWLGAEGAPTILVYGHYDVQPPGDEREWTTPPFEPSVRDGRIYARGATDDKGPVLVALAVAEAFLAADGVLPLNVRFLVEGEEEIGSPSLAAFLRGHRDELAADLVVSADGAMWRPSEPSIAIAAKGLLALDVVVTGPSADLHSGRHGGAVQNPVHALARIVAGLHGPDGAVAVPRFYDGVLPLSAAERDALARIPFDDEAYRDEVGVPVLHGEPGFTTLERLWTRPTLEVNGVEAGGRFTVIPRRARAHVTCRLVPEQDPVEVLAAVARHVHATRPPGVEVAVEPEPGAVRAYSIPAGHPAVSAAAAALRAVYPDREPLLVRMGGTLPAATLFEEALGLKTLLFSFSTSDERLHAPDEFFRLSRLDEGLRAWAELWRLLALDDPANVLDNPQSHDRRRHGGRPA